MTLKHVFIQTFESVCVVLNIFSFTLSHILIGVKLRETQRGQEMGQGILTGHNVFVAALENVFLFYQQINFSLFFRLKIVKISFKCKQFFIQIRKEAVSGTLFFFFFPFITVILAQ